MLVIIFGGRTTKRWPLLNIGQICLNNLLRNFEKILRTTNYYHKEAYHKKQEVLKALITVSHKSVRKPLFLNSSISSRQFSTFLIYLLLIFESAYLVNIQYFFQQFGYFRWILMYFVNVRVQYHKWMTLFIVFIQHEKVGKREEFIDKCQYTY